MQSSSSSGFPISPGVGGLSQQVSGRGHWRHVVGWRQHAAGWLRLVDQRLEDADVDYDGTPSGGNHMLVVREASSPMHQLTKCFYPVAL